MSLSRRFGGVRVTKVTDAGDRITAMLERRTLRVLDGASSQGLNYTLLTALSIGASYAYIGVPWSQAVDLNSQEADDLAEDTLMMHPEVEFVVISLAHVKGTLKSQERTYYCVTPDWLWRSAGDGSNLHEYITTVSRQGDISGKTQHKNSSQEPSRKPSGIPSGKRKRRE